MYRSDTDIDKIDRYRVFPITDPIIGATLESTTTENNSKSEYIDPDPDALLLQASQQFESTTVENNSKSDKENKQCSTNSRFGWPQRESDIKFIKENRVPKNTCEEHKLGSANLATMGYRKATAANGKRR